MKPQPDTEIQNEIVKVPPAPRRNGPNFRSWLPKAFKALKENPVGVQSDGKQYCIFKKDRLDALALHTYARRRGVKLVVRSTENGFQIFVKG
jgi:hypothetical protein